MTPRRPAPVVPFATFPPGASNAAIARAISRMRGHATLAREEDDDRAAQDAGQLEDGVPLADPGLALPDGTAVLIAPGDAADTGDDATLQRKALPPGRAVLMRDVDPLSGGLGAAGFAASLRQSDQGALGMTHVQFRATGAKKGAATPADTEYSILLLDSRHALGTAWAWFSLYLRFDGKNILSGYTRLWSSSGYAGGPLGSDANVSFAAVEGSGAEDDAKSVIITCDGTNNPNGPGFQKFFAQFTARGDGAVTIDRCVNTVGDGVTKTAPTAYAGFKESW